MSYKAPGVLEDVLTVYTADDGWLIQSLLRSLSASKLSLSTIPTTLPAIPINHPARQMVVWVGWWLGGLGRLEGGGWGVEEGG